MRRNGATTNYGIEGMDVVDKIVATPQKSVNMLFQNLPVTPVVIESVKLLK